MKRFPNGMAGVCITTLAIMGMVLSGYALSVQESERVVTGYEYITDVSGLFDYSEDPQYVAYNPAENWTGFYTADPDVTDGIDFNVSGAANSYPISQEPNTISSESVTLSSLDLDQLDPPTNPQTQGYRWAVKIGSDEPIGPYAQSGEINRPYVASLSDLAASQGGTDVDSIIIDLTAPDDDTFGAIITTAADWIYTEQVTSLGGVTRWHLYTLPYYEDQAITKAEITLESGLVKLYRGDAVVTTGSASSYQIVYSNPAYDSNGQLSESAEISKVGMPPAIYMNTNDGITLTESPVYWSNGYPIGGIDVLFRVPTTGQEYTNTIVFPLTDGPGGTDAGTITAYIAVSSGGRVQVSLDSGTEQQTIDIGQWRNFILSMDFIDGVYRVVPVTNFATFNDYSEVDNARTFTGISARGTAEIVTWGFSGHSLTLGIVQTEVFMNTYGVVMTNPSLTITDYFPELTDLRLNFYSFALYGDSITVNGKTYAVTDDAQINIPQVGDDGEPVDSYHTLTNIYITFEDHTYITFVNEDFTADLGPTTTDTVSFAGNWYFTTGLYEGFETTETYSEWTPEKFVFDSNGAIIVYLGLLALGTAVIAKVAGIRALDIVIVACAGIFGYVMLGAF